MHDDAAAPTGAASPDDARFASMSDDARFASMLDDLARRGWSVCPDLVPRAEVRALVEESEARFEAGLFRRAGIGRGAAPAVRAEIRSDRIYWLDPDDLAPATARYWALLGRWREALNQAFFLGLRGVEAHYAVYPVGSYYKRHLDQFKDTQARLISCLLYLNEDWRPADGGALRIYEPGPGGTETHVDVWPEAGTFVCFRSDTVYHEVLPTARERYAVTGWMRRDAGP